MTVALCHSFSRAFEKYFPSYMVALGKDHFVFVVHSSDVVRAFRRTFMPSHVGVKQFVGILPASTLMEITDPVFEANRTCSEKRKGFLIKNYMFDTFIKQLHAY